jgi:1-acyl-sn-glycerol-3-phosphate acyltransferase
VVRFFCRPLTVAGRRNVPNGPAIYVANHASHADTAVLLAALPRVTRRRLAPAAAEDYFFATRTKGAVISLLTGAFPFARAGGDGLARARRLLDDGWSILLFPEGTRSRSGAMGSFKCGVGKLAARGYPVVPVGVAGTHAVLSPGASFPRRGSVAVVIGKSVRYRDVDSPPAVAADLEHRVCTLRGRAVRLRRPASSTYQVANALASSRAGLVLAFCWGLAEAIVFPIVPDFALALLAVAAPRRFGKLALAALCGSVAGGAVAYGLGAAFGPAPVTHVPLVTGKMVPAAAAWLDHSHGWALWHQVAFGVPYKVFAWQAAGHSTTLPSLAFATAVVRGLRLFAVASVFALIGRSARRWAGRFYGAFVVVFSAGFGLGLARVVGRWS